MKSYLIYLSGFQYWSMIGFCYIASKLVEIDSLFRGHKFQRMSEFFKRNSSFGLVDLDFGENQVYIGLSEGLIN